LWAISMLISLAFAGLDGRYLRSYMFVGWLGDVMAYTGNFLIDLSSEFLVYEWTRHQRDTVAGAARDRKRSLSWGLMIGAGGLLYFALIFSYRQAVLLKPDEPDLYRWSVAAFAQFALLWLGWANALRDFPETQTSKESKAQKKQQEEQEKLLRDEFAQHMSWSSRRAPQRATHQVLQRDGWRCFYCDADMKDWTRDRVHIDHFYPAGKGGSDDPMNLVVSCDTCNFSKNDREPTPAEVNRFKINLIATADLDTKDKIHLHQHAGLLETQKEIAAVLGVSASYVSSVLRDTKNELSEPALQFQNSLDQVGRPAIVETVESESQGDNGQHLIEGELSTARGWANEARE